MLIVMISGWDEGMERENDGKWNEYEKLEFLQRRKGERERLIQRLENY